MKKIISIIFCVALLPAVAKAQSCNASIAESTPDAQFQISNDEVLDYRTNLIWKRCAVGKTWTGTTCTGTSDSLTWAQALAAGTTGNWRLPNIKELLSIVEVSCGLPAINEAIFPNTSNEFFWTSSPYVNNNQAWSVSFEDGNDQGGDKSGGAAVRLVRDVAN